MQFQRALRTYKSSMHCSYGRQKSQLFLSKIGFQNHCINSHFSFHIVQPFQKLPTATMAFAKKKKKDDGEEKDKKKGGDLEAVISQLEKSFGKGTIMKLGDSSERGIVNTISTGSLGLDIALGIGGLARGRITEIYGLESSGKTTLALHVIAEAHKSGGKACFIDAEHALDANWAKKLGVNIDQLLVCQPDSGEQALEIADTLVSSGTMDVIVIDSVAALVPKAELEGEMGAHHPGSQARLMSQALRKLTGNLSKTNKTILIFINQIRHKIGVMFGSPETTSGGNALKFYSSARLDIRRVGSLKNGEQVVGNHVRVKVVKNKLAPPFKETLFDIEFGKGISKVELVDLAVTTKVLEKSGAWYSYNGEKIAQGREKAKLYFEANPDVANAVEKVVREKLLSDPSITNLAVGNFEEIAITNDVENLIQEIEETKV